MAVLRLTSIVALNEDGVIGAGNKLPWRIRSDLRFFRQQTVGNVVIMGRRTFDSLKGPLPDRRNIVVTHGFALFPSSKFCVPAGGIAEALARASKEKLKRQEVFIIGGESMYRQFAPFVDRYLITEVQKKVPDGDTFFSSQLLGDGSAWDCQLLLEGKANTIGDEADFRVFEFKSKTPSEFSRRRNQEIGGHFRSSASNEIVHPYDGKFASVA